MGALFKKYKSAFKEAWQARCTNRSPKRLPHEIQFLPAHLALQETPVSPAPRVAVWGLTLFILVTILWAIVGKIDIIVSSEGKIIPNDKVKTIQPIETSTVKSILVTEGAEVKKGTPLVELDNTAPEADTKRLEEEVLRAELQAARAASFLDALKINAKEAIFLVETPTSLTGEEQSQQQQWLTAEYTEFQNKVSTHQAEIKKVEASVKTTEAIILKLEKTAPMAEEKTQDFKKLLDKQVISKHHYYEARKNSIEEAQELKAQKYHLEEVRFELAQNQKKLAAFIAETTRILLSTFHESKQKADTLRYELQKAKQRNRLMQLVAPIDGTVQQLSIHTVGGVVTPAQPLMVIVPHDHPLEVEASIENQDIGFVTKQQPVEVKIKAFPYTKYGTIPGTVLHLSSDAISNEQKNLVYLARIQLSKTTLRVGQKQIALFPGMEVTAEIKTGKRRVIEYFLNPLLQHQSESLKER